MLQSVAHPKLTIPNTTRCGLQGDQQPQMWQLLIGTMPIKSCHFALWHFALWSRIQPSTAGLGTDLSRAWWGNCGPGRNRRLPWLRFHPDRTVDTALLSCTGIWVTFIPKFRYGIPTYQVMSQTPTISACIHDTTKLRHFQ